MKNYRECFTLKGKTIFVVGGAGLIGCEVSKAVADAGGKVIILDSNVKKAKKLATTIRNKKGKCAVEDFDITDLDGMENVIKLLVKKYKRIDGWVNLAYPRTEDWGKKVEDLDIKSVQKNVDMQLNSYAWSARVAALVMKRLKIKGSIVNCSSIYGMVASDFTLYEGTTMTSPMAYSMIKSGIINLSRYLASYFGKYDIRVNAISPGGILDSQNKTFVKNYEKKVPLKRLGRPEDLAPAVVFLLSSASGYVTGTNMVVDGGWTSI